MRAIIIISICIAEFVAEDVVKVTAGDTYIEAYRETSSASSNEVVQAEKKMDGGYPVYSGPSTQYAPPDHYGHPENNYGPTLPEYGPPLHQYGPSGPKYGPPVPQYGPPAPQYGSQFPPSYGSFAEPMPQYGASAPIYAPPAQNLQVFYGMPHAMISIWDKLWEKLKWKLNLFTLGKIILKLVIFKKIVSLIAIICILLFIPSLKHKKFLNGDDGSERSLKTNMTVDDSLNRLSAFVMESIDNNTNKENSISSSCDTVYCRARRMLNKLDDRLSVKKLTTLYIRERNWK